MRTVEQVIAALQRPSGIERLASPEYRHELARTGRAMLAVESFARHMSSEGWQLQEGLRLAGYTLHGCYGGEDLNRPGFTDFYTARLIINNQLGVAVVQDKREWDSKSPACIEKQRDFYDTDQLREHPEIFRVTILKDAHQQPTYHREAADEIGCHAWITYYNPRIVCHLAPYVRPEHVIRTYHTLDRYQVPPLPMPGDGRKGCLISGAVGLTAYPLRTRLIKEQSKFGGSLTWLRHPGYHANGHATPKYLKTMGRFRVAICTSSIYAYSLRKIAEATACGCRVITDLPVDDEMPFIEENLHRIDSGESTERIAELARELESSYSVEQQRALAFLAMSFYDYRDAGERLYNSIEEMSLEYNERTNGLQS